MRVARTGLLAAALGLLACERPYLTWTPREPLVARRGQVAVSVEDHRPGDPARLGHAFGWGGAPADILVGRDHVRERVERLTKEAVITAGRGLWSPAELPTARLRVEVLGLDCDGHGLHARATVAVRYALGGPDAQVSGTAEAIDTAGTGRDCQDAYTKALDALFDELAARLVDEAPQPA